MLQLAAHLFLTSALLLLVAHLVPGVTIKSWGSAILGALMLGLINAFVRPVMVFLTLPLTFLTLGFFLLVINALVLQLMAALVPGVRVRGCTSALIGSLLLSLLNLAVSALARSF